MLFGAFAAALAALASGFKTGSMALYAIAFAFVAVGLLRFLNMIAFEAANVAPDDADAAEVWEARATLGGVAVATVFGAWCFASLVVVDDGFSQVTSISISVAAMVGVVARNFGLDRLVFAQSTILCLLMGAGLVMGGDPYRILFAALLVVMIVSFRDLAGQTRALLLNTVHDRVKANKLAGELDTAMTTMPHGLCMIDNHNIITVMNQQCVEWLMGVQNKDFVGCHIKDFLKAMVESGKVTPDAMAQIEFRLSSGTNNKMILLADSDSYFEVTQAFRNGYTVLMFEDITERVNIQERISYLARFDELTGLPNRSFFSDNLEAALQGAQNGSAEGKVMLMLIDVDGFKHVNDTYGHPAGDRLLREVGHRLRQVLGGDLMIGRFGGDEFVVARVGPSDSRLFEEDAKAVVAGMRIDFNLDGEHISVSGSVGMVVQDCRDEHLDLLRLLKRADLALYKAKAAGGSQWAVFHEGMDVAYKQRQKLKSELPQALENGHLFLHYQPVIDIDTRRIVGSEALVRWRHPELGNIPPLTFLPLAEEIGAMADLSRFVLETATRECRTWPADMWVSVNLSATDFRTTQVDRMVSQALTASGLDASRLIVEITESALIDEPETVSQAVIKIREFGVGVALDDFGTGYSSLSYLQSMSFTKLKIDRSFVQDVVVNERAQKLLKHIAHLSRDLDMTLTVEGIETEEQLGLVVASRFADDAQGYLFGAPMPAADFRELISHMLPGSTDENRKRLAAVR